MDQNFAYKDYDFNVAPEQTDVDTSDNETPDTDNNIDTNKYNGVKVRFTGETDIYGTYITAWHNEEGYDVECYNGETMRLTHDGVVFAVVREADIEVIGSIDEAVNDNVINDVTPADSQPADSEPESCEDERTATVQPGGSFWQIANDYLGDGNRAAELAEYNGMTLESGLYAGMILKLPD